MAKIRKSKFEQKFENLAVILTKFTGSTVAFIFSFLLILIWGISGPVFNYSEGWQLVINTGTTIITFLMVFLIQRAQNKDSLAIQLKLNEIIAATSGASNTLVDIEELNERDLEILRTHYRKLGKLFEKDVDLTKSHTVEEAENRHKRKLKTIK